MSQFGVCVFSSCVDITYCPSLLLMFISFILPLLTPSAILHLFVYLYDFSLNINIILFVSPLNSFCLNPSFCNILLFYFPFFLLNPLVYAPVSACFQFSLNPIVLHFQHHPFVLYLFITFVCVPTLSPLPSFFIRIIVINVIYFALIFFFFICVPVSSPLRYMSLLFLSFSLCLNWVSTPTFPSLSPQPSPRRPLSV